MFAVIWTLLVASQAIAQHTGGSLGGSHFGDHSSRVGGGSHYGGGGRSLSTWETRDGSRYRSTPLRDNDNQTDAFLIAAGVGFASLATIGIALLVSIRKRGSVIVQSNVGSDDSNRKST
ncbi:MAG: hypothetical protein IPK60_14685 [Sandaracinaceae bacterium]|nr:hypothetical protein [Sandaracinaceae bacterium]